LASLGITNVFTKRRLTVNNERRIDMKLEQKEEKTTSQWNLPSAPKLPGLLQSARIRGDENHMAKIVRFYKVGGPEVLKIEDVPSRQPAKNEARLRVQAIGLNRSESMFMHGYYVEPTQLPATLGYEASGIVTAVGANVDPGWLNKSVSTVPSFSMNQYGVLGDEVIVPVHSLAEYPSHLTPIEATSIWMQYMTAYGALVEFGQVKKGEFVLITAASSSAGLAAIQTVKAEGAISIATTRTRAKRDELLVLGADHVIVTDEEDLVARVKDITDGVGARIIFDPIAGPLLDKLAEAAATGATIFEYGLLSGAQTPFPLVPAIQKALNIRGYWLAEITAPELLSGHAAGRLTNPERLARAKNYVYNRVKTGQLKPKIAKTFRFEDVVEAYQYMESNEQIGKIVLTVGE
jgi:NADPH:quinone reductase-like Zn-dependent oxidoreductase